MPKKYWLHRYSQMNLTIIFSLINWKFFSFVNLNRTLSCLSSGIYYCSYIFNASLSLVSINPIIWLKLFFAWFKHFINATNIKSFKLIIYHSFYRLANCSLHYHLRILLNFMYEKCMVIHSSMATTVTRHSLIQII